MGKRSKKKKSRRPTGKQKSNQSKPATLAQDIEKTVLQLRGRRSMVMSRKLKQDISIPPEKREKLAAAAHEVFVRELLDGGHTTSAVDHAQSVAKNNPMFCYHWALSLQIKMGLVTDLEALA